MERSGGYIIFSKWFAKRLAYLAMAAVLFGCALSAVLVSADGPGGGGRTGSGPDWIAPSAMAVRRIGPPDTRQDTPGLFSNIDCTPVTYRLVAGRDMQEGCFTGTAFGMMDIDSSTIIFNGTDEGLPIRPYTAHQILVPWPAAGDMLALNPLSTGGTLVGLYKDPVKAMRDRRNAEGALEGKDLAAAPDLILKDDTGRPLVINPQTLAFSRGGGWLAAETLEGSFVRVDLGRLAAQPFAPAYGSTGSPALLRSQAAVSEDGRLIAIANDYAGAFKLYGLEDCDPPSRDSVLGLPPEHCASYDYRAFVKSKIPGLRSIGRLRFVNDGLLSFEAVSSDSAFSGTYELAPAAAITALTDYIGLGDSYTSGEGAFDYLSGTDTPDNTCHQSVNSYPLLLARDLFGAAGGHSAACSGAVIDDIGSTDGNYKGQVKDGLDLDELRRDHPQSLESIETGFLPGYIAQQRFISRWQPRIATVSIAGNDIGFGDILSNCVAPHLGLGRGTNTCYSTYEERLEVKNLIDRTVPRWEALFSQLKSEAPGMRLYVLGYPQIALSSGNCGTNVRLDRKELEFAAATVDYIDQDVREAAAESGAAYVDISRALYGHRLCEAKGYAVAMNGLTAGNDFGVAGLGLLGRESYHPNALGQELIEQSILRQTGDLGLTEPDAAGSPEQAGDSGGTVTTGAALLDAPASGRTVYVLVPDDDMTVSSAARGGGIHIRADAGKDGLRPDASYTVRLDGPSGTMLGTVDSDASGGVDGDVAVPAEAAPGGHRIDLVGPNQDGAPVDVTRPLYIMDDRVVMAAPGLAPILGPSGNGIGPRPGSPPGIGPENRPYVPQPEPADPDKPRVLGASGIPHAVHRRQSRTGRALLVCAAGGILILILLAFTVRKINKKGVSGLQW